MFQRTRSADQILADMLRSEIANNRGQYIGLAFVKRDGTIRRMTMQQGNDASYLAHTERGDRMSATFHANNPRMMKARDVYAMRRGCESKGWRTIDLDCLMFYKVGKVTHHVRTYQEARLNALPVAA